MRPVESDAEPALSQSHRAGDLTARGGGCVDVHIHSFVGEEIGDRVHEGPGTGSGLADKRDRLENSPVRRRVKMGGAEGAGEVVVRDPVAQRRPIRGPNDVPGSLAGRYRRGVEKVDRAKDLLGLHPRDDECKNNENGSRKDSHSASTWVIGKIMVRE